jgi:hypothetical protein
LFICEKRITDFILHLPHRGLNKVLETSGVSGFKGVES